MTIPLLTTMLMLLVGIAAAQQHTRRVPQVVPFVDFERYSGTWYEIARLPNRFQEDCVGDVTATYTLRTDGSLDVVNRCRKPNGEVSESSGRARKASEAEPNSKLEVRFAPAIFSFLPFVWGDYWILDLASDYSYVVIGEPKRRYLWILARQPTLADEVLQRLLSRVQQDGYSLEGLIRTRQSHR